MGDRTEQVTTGRCHAPPGLPVTGFSQWPCLRVLSRTCPRMAHRATGGDSPRLHCALPAAGPGHTAESPGPGASLCPCTSPCLPRERVLQAQGSGKGPRAEALTGLRREGRFAGWEHGLGSRGPAGPMLSVQPGVPRSHLPVSHPEGTARPPCPRCPFPEPGRPHCPGCGLGGPWVLPSQEQMTHRP